MIGISRILLCFLLALLCSCTQTKNRCSEPTSALWMFVSDDSNYYELYWDKQGNLFGFNGAIGEHHLDSLEDDTTIIKFIEEIKANPKNERESTFGIMNEFYGVNQFKSARLLGRFNYYVDSNPEINFLIFKEQSYKRYLDWLMPDKKDTTLIETRAIDITDTIFPD